MLCPSPRAAQPMCVSRIWPTFMRLGTPSGFSTRSTWRAVRQERHVLVGHHLGNHALVAVTAGHLVTRLQLALHRDIDLDHLHHARRQIVAAADLFHLVLEPAIQRAFLQLVLGIQRLDGLRRLFRRPGQAATTGRATGVPSSSSSITEPALTPFGPFTAFLPRIDLSGAHRCCAPGSSARRRGRAKGVRLLHARSARHARPCRRHAG